MKKFPFLLLAACVFFAYPLSAQHYEFRTHPNGLIYDGATMQQLHHIVDSLNLKFSSCEPSKTYYAVSQARGHYIRLENGNSRQARQDMASNMSLEEFMRKYPHTHVEKDLLITKQDYTNYREEKQVVYESVPVDGRYGHSLYLDVEKAASPASSRWIFKKGTNSDKTLTAFYVPEKFTSTPLPERYARMLQYTNCLIDTTTQIFFDSAERNSRWNPDKPDTSSKAEELVHYLNELLPAPDYAKFEDYEDYSLARDTWRASRDKLIDEQLAPDPAFRQRLMEAAEEALQQGNSDDEFEYFVGKYLSPETELALKRSRIVVGSCSMDDSPRQHAVNIAMLSAKTIKWDIFLRAHLDIMNDNFERMSDGSWAWEGRQTYIKELEELDIQVPDLLLGISLRIENPSRYHYYGSIGRLGRALAESRQAAVLEEKMQQMISDPQLDDYNRMLMYYLYVNYIHHLDDAAGKQQNIRRLSQSVASLPPYLSSQIDVLKVLKEE